MRVLPLGGDDQTELPRRPEFWLSPREFGVVEEWVGWLAVNSIEPLTDRSLAGLRALVKAHADQPPVQSLFGGATDPRLLEALKRAAAHEMTPAERHAQRRSWIIGEMGIEHPEMNRAQLEALADRAVGPALTFPTPSSATAEQGA